MYFPIVFLSSVFPCFIPYLFLLIFVLHFCISGSRCFIKSPNAVRTYLIQFEVSHYSFLQLHSCFSGENFHCRNTVLSIFTIVLYGWGLVSPPCSRFLSRVGGGIGMLFVSAGSVIFSSFPSLTATSPIGTFFPCRAESPPEERRRPGGFSKRPLPFLHACQLLPCSQCYELPSPDLHPVFSIWTVSFWE